MFLVKSVSCSLVVLCWERADLLACLYLMFSFVVFVTFPYGVMGHMWYLIISIPDHIHLNAENNFSFFKTLDVSIKLKNRQLLAF